MSISKQAKCAAHSWAIEHLPQQVVEVKNLIKAWAKNEQVPERICWELRYNDIQGRKHFVWTTESQRQREHSGEVCLSSAITGTEHLPQCLPGAGYSAGWLLVPVWYGC